MPVGARKEVGERKAKGDSRQHPCPLGIQHLTWSRQRSDGPSHNTVHVTKALRRGSVCSNMGLKVEAAEERVGEETLLSRRLAVGV